MKYKIDYCNPDCRIDKDMVRVGEVIMDTNNRRLAAYAYPDDVEDAKADIKQRNAEMIERINGLPRYL